jgi:hypothetical protein
MKKNPLNKGILTENSVGVGPVTPEMIRTRAREEALIEGGVEAKVSSADQDQARRELTGGSKMDAQEALLDSIPESERWDPVPGSAGHQAPESPSEDEDEEGRSETEQLVDEGVDEAGRDRMLQAARALEKKDRRAT